MPLVKPLRLVVAGFSRVGRVCAELICRSHDLSIAAFIRRAASAGGALPDQLRHIPVFTHIGQAGDVDSALICGGWRRDRPIRACQGHR